MSLPAYDATPSADGGRLIVLTAPITEAIDHAAYFIQMALASLPIWMEGVINRKNLQRMGKIYRGKPLKLKTRRKLLASLKPKDWQYLHADNGDMPVEFVPRAVAHAMSAQT